MFQSIQTEETLRSNKKSDTTVTKLWKSNTREFEWVKVEREKPRIVLVIGEAGENQKVS